MPARKPVPDAFYGLCELYKSAKISTTDIACSLGVSKSTVLKWMDQLGIDRHYSGVMIAAKSVGIARGKGAKRSEESRARMRESAKLRAPRPVGQKRSEEARRRMSEAAQRRWAGHTYKRPKKAIILAQLPKPPRQPHEPKPPREKLSPEEVIARTKARDACKRMLRRILVMSRIRKDRRTEVMLGYSKDELRRHLESQFRNGMSWAARESFHIDHITPVSYFLKRGITDPSIINALSNLQVLTPEENREKSDRLVIDKGGTRPFMA